MEHQDRLRVSRLCNGRTSTADPVVGSSSVPIQYDSHWGDPNADITFQSSQGLCFRISSWVLAKHSAFFGRLRQETPYTSMPIKTHMNNTLLEALLTKIILRPQSPDAVLEVYSPRLDDKIRLRAFFKIFEFNQAFHAIEQALLAIIKRTLWPTLRAASYYDDLALAVLAIGGMDVQHLNVPDFWANVQDLRPEWQAAFVLAVLSREIAPTDGGLKFKEDAALMARDFEGMVNAGKGSALTVTGPFVKDEAGDGETTRSGDNKRQAEHEYERVTKRQKTESVEEDAEGEDE